MKNTDTKEIKIIPLKYDFMFKRVFSLNLELLKEFLICVLDLDVEAKDANIILENVELTKSVKREYQKTVDILVRLNNPIIPSDISIDVEVNSSRYEDIKYRNVLYLQKIMTSYIESSSNLKDMTKYSFYQLNLNVHKFKDNTGEKKFYLKEDTTNELLIDNFKIVHKSLDYYSKLYYNKEENLSKDVIWLAFINAKNFKEMKEMAFQIMTKKKAEKFLNDVKDASRDKLILSEWESEKMAELVKTESLKNATREGEEKGFEQGIEQGIEQEKKDTIKNMLKNNIDIGTISKITGKTPEEIKKIAESLKD